MHLVGCRAHATYEKIENASEAEGKMLETNRRAMYENLRIVRCGNCLDGYTFRLILQKMASQSIFKHRSLRKGPLRAVLEKLPNIHHKRLEEKENTLLE